MQSRLDHTLKLTCLEIMGLDSAATCWTVRGSNPGGDEIFHNLPERPWEPPSLLYNGYRNFPAGKAAGAWR